MVIKLSSELSFGKCLMLFFSLRVEGSFLLVSSCIMFFLWVLYPARYVFERISYFYRLFTFEFVDSTVPLREGVHHA